MGLQKWISCTIKARQNFAIHRVVYKSFIRYSNGDKYFKWQISNTQN